MRSLVLLLAILSTFALESPVIGKVEQEQLKLCHYRLCRSPFFEATFQTRVDHFTPLNKDLVDFHYNGNANYYEPDGPIYIYIKDPSDSSTQWIERGLMVDIAQDTNATLFTFDMRFFGRNRPTSDTSFENLKLLTVEQTLADIATFVRYIRQYNRHIDEYSKIILWGAGYGGSLAVWARKRYPHLITASWSSSGSFALSTYSFAPFNLLKMSLVPNADDTDCRDRLERAYEILQMLMKEDLVKVISDSFNLCHPIDVDSRDDVASFYEQSIRAVINHIRLYHQRGVAGFCFNMRATLADPLNAFAIWFVYVYGDGTCFDHTFGGLVEYYGNPNWNHTGVISGRRQLYYLECTQFGGFPIADHYTWIPQDVPVQYYINKCNEIFDTQFNVSTLHAAINQLNIDFAESISNVVYTNGNIDPFRFFGRQYDARGEVININYHGQSADLASLSPNDPVPLYEVKERIRSLIEDWSSWDTHCID